MARARLVRAGQDGVDDAEVRGWTDTLGRYRVAGADDTVGSGGVLEGPHDRGADRDDAPALGARALQFPRSALRYSVGFVERQSARRGPDPPSTTVPPRA